MSKEYMKPPESPETLPEKNLEEQLVELQQKQDAADAAEAEYAGLEKLIEDTQKAEGDYAKAYDQLQDRETRLKTERDALYRALQAALGDAGIAEVEETIAEMVTVVSEAETAHKDAEKAVGEAQINADDAADELAALQADLDMWRKPGDSIDKRLKVAEGLIEQIKRLRNAGKRREAYWKLALGDHVVEPDKKFLVSQVFLDKVLSRHPEVIETNEVHERIRTAWNKFREARTKAAAANEDLAEAQAASKLKETDFADKSKNLINTIALALAESEASSDAT